MNIIQSIKKYVVSSATVILFVIYVVYQRVNDSVAQKSIENLPVKKIAPIDIPVNNSVGIYRDGSYPGSLVFVYDSDIQVQAIIQNGRLSDIKFLVYPDRTQYSREVAAESIPTLVSEAIQAQSAEVDAVSGATYTSASFKESLASALVLAKK